MNKRIKKLRKTLGLTQEKFANRIGMKQNSIALIESGRNTSDQTILSICREFNVNENWLRTGNGEMFNQTDRKEELIRSIERFLSNESDLFKERLFSVLNRLDESDWAILAKLAIKIAGDRIDYLNDELSITKESDIQENEIPEEHTNMSIEEIEKNADFWDNLYKKKRALLDFQKQDDNMKRA